MEEKEEEPKEERERLSAWYPEYFVVTGGNRWIVSSATAREIDRALKRWPRPKWIRFVTVAGATVRIKLAWLGTLEQSTPESRELMRRFHRERQEESELPPWETDW